MDMNATQSRSQEVRVIGLRVIFVDLRVIIVSLGAWQGHNGMVPYTILLSSESCTIDERGWAYCQVTSTVVEWGPSQPCWNFTCNWANSSSILCIHSHSITSVQRGWAYCNSFHQLPGDWMVIVKIVSVKHCEYKSGLIHTVWTWSSFHAGGHIILSLVSFTHLSSWKFDWPLY